MELKKIIFIALIALIALTGIASAAINTINIVVQDTSYNPISGATISLTVPGYSTYTRTTGADGKPTSPFSGYNVASPTSAAITISKTGYSTYTSSGDTFMEKTSTPGYTYTYTYPLASPTTTAITITVKDSINYANIPGASVSITSATPTSLITDNTGTTGTFIVPLSGFTVQISKSGYQGYTATDSVDYMSTTQPLVFYIVNNVAPTPTPELAHALVSYHIYDEGTTNGVPGATITIRDNTNTVIGSGTTTSIGTQPGSFTKYFTPIPSSYSIVVSKSGYSDYTHTYSSAPVDDSTVSISLTAVTPTPTPTPDPNSYSSFIPLMTSDTAPSPNSVIYSHSAEGAYLAFNHVTEGSNGGTWYVYGNTQSTEYVGIHTGSTGHIAKKYTIWAYNNPLSVGESNTLVSTAWQFQGSNDGSSWDTLDTRSSQTWTAWIGTVCDNKSFTISNTNSYTYYRVLSTSHGSNVGFTEIDILENTPVPTSTPTPAPTPALTSIRVQVQDSINHANIPGATVSIPSASPTSLTTDNTGTTGTFQISTSSSGYAVSISASGYASNNWTDYVDYSETSQTLTFYLVANIAPTPTAEPAHALVSYHIYDESTNTGVPGATITIHDNTNTVIGSGTTTSIGTEPGRFMKYFVPPPPSYSITVTKIGYTNYTFTYSSAPIDESIQTIYLSPSILILNVDIKSATTGYLIQGAWTGIYDPEHNVWRNRSTSTGMGYFDSTGPNFEYPLFIGKNITLVSWAEGYQFWSQDMTIFSPNYIKTINLVPDNTLPTGDEYTIVFTVLSNYNKQPISDITVTAGLGAIKLTNSAGAATFQNVPAGVTTMFDFSGSGYLGATIPLTGTAGQVIMRQVELVQIGATPTPTPTSNAVSNSTARSTDLNTKGQTFIQNWADIAVNFGGFIFLMGLVFFMKKAGR